MLWTHEAKHNIHNIHVQENVFFRAWPSSWHKERARVVYYFLAIWLVYSPKWTFLIGYYNKTQLPQEFGIEQSDRKIERLFTKIQFLLFSYCKYSSRIIIILRQNINICNSAAMVQPWKKLFWKGQSTGVWKKGIAWHIDESSSKLAKQIARLVAIVVKCLIPDKI